MKREVEREVKCEMNVKRHQGRASNHSISLCVSEMTQQEANRTRTTHSVAYSASDLITGPKSPEHFAINVHGACCAALISSYTISMANVLLAPVCLINGLDLNNAQLHVVSYRCRRCVSRYTDSNLYLFGSCSVDIVVGCGITCSHTHTHTHTSTTREATLSALTPTASTVLLAPSGTRHSMQASTHPS